MREKVLAALPEKYQTWYKDAPDSLLDIGLNGKYNKKCKHEGSLFDLEGASSGQELIRLADKYAKAGEGVSN
jgi:hypothetical protein